MRIFAIAGVVLASMLVAQNATAAESPGAPVHYVALGDSRATGPSWLSYLGGDGCGRSESGYPTVLAGELDPASFTDVACGGATTANLVSTPQNTFTPLPHRVPVQIDALRPETTLVTVSIGGNDLNWADLIGPCLRSIPQVDPECRTNPTVTSRIDRKLAQLAPAMRGVLLAVRERSPQARTVVLGHGGYFGPNGCFPDANLYGADAAFVLDFFARFDEVLRSSAVELGALFVDVAGPAVGHDACAPVDERWFTGSLTPGPTPFLHPTPLGSAAMARLVLAALGS